MNARIAKDVVDCLVSASELRISLNDGDVEAAHARLNSLIARLDDILTSVLLPEEPA